MSQATSSAEPEKLLRYAEVSAQLDGELAAAAGRLAAQLEAFENACLEPQRVQASHLAGNLRQHTQQAAEIAAQVRAVGLAFQQADGIWAPRSFGGSSTSGNTSPAWSATALSATILSLLQIPSWLAQQLFTVPWILQNYSQWMPDLTKSFEFLGRYIAKRQNISEADFNPLDVALFLFSKTPFCDNSCKSKLEDVGDLKTAYEVVFQFSQANFMFFMAGILSNPERYIDPWLDKVNNMTLFPDRPVGSGKGPTNLQGRDMSEMPHWMQVLFGRTDTSRSPHNGQGNVLGVSTVNVGEMPSITEDGEQLNLTNMSLQQRRQHLAQVHTEVDALNSKLADLRSSGASEQLNSGDLERQIATLQQRQADLQLQTGNWRNRVAVSEQGLKLGFDDGILDTPWRTKSDDFEDEISRLSKEISALEARLPTQREFDRTFVQLRAAENMRGELEKSLANYWWNNVPTQSQQKLTYKGEPNAYGCAPTATAMVLDYWHTQDLNNKTMSAQALIDTNAIQGKFTATGMSAANIHDEIKNLNYGVIQDYLGSDFDTLRAEVDKGPVIATVKLNMATSGKNHSVVVTGISPDGSMVRVNDPWTGQSHIYTKAQFTQSWGADFGVGTSKNNFTVIRPS